VAKSFINTDIKDRVKMEWL